MQKGVSIYLYNTSQLDKDNWQTTLQGQQRQVIQNLYSKRLESQLSDEVAARVIKEGNNQKLKSYFAGPDFQFLTRKGVLSAKNSNLPKKFFTKSEILLLTG